MANDVSAEQRLELAMSLVRNADWSRLTPQKVQIVIDAAPKTGGKEFTRFVENGGWMQIGDFFRETGEVTINIPALPRPTLAELREKFSWIRKENGIERDTSPTGAVTLKFGTVLREGEPSIGGAEYERRIAPKLDIILGYQQTVWLVEHQDEFPEFMALLGKVYIDFSGLVVVDANGRRVFPYLLRDGGRWDLDWVWAENDLPQDGRVAVSGK